MSDHNQSIHKVHHHHNKPLDILIIYRNINVIKPGSSSILGLGVNTQHTINVLTKLGFNVKSAAAWEIDDLISTITKFNETNPPKICLIEAPWVAINNMLKLVEMFPHIHFIVRSHSQLAFLQVEQQAVQLIRDLLVYSESIPNLSVAANSTTFCKFVESVYHAPCTYLPNLYDYERVNRKHKHPFSHGRHHILKAGSFGAIRLQKNHMTGAAAALVLAQELGVDLEFYLTTNRIEGGGAIGVVKAIENLFTGLHWAKLVCVPWSNWPTFRKMVAEMDVCFHLSCTETFSLSTADCLAEGVGVVSSDVIDWIPKQWYSNIDNPFEAANVGKRILFDHNTPDICDKTLQSIEKQNEKVWVDYLS